MKKLEDLTREEKIEKFINTLYIFSHGGYVNVKQINLGNLCKIYDVPPKVVNLLEKEKAINVSSMRTMVKWVGDEPSRKFSAKIASLIKSNKSISNMNTTNKITRKFHKKRSWSESDLRKLVSMEHLPMKIIAEDMGRTVGAVSGMLSRIKSGDVNIETKSTKRVTRRRYTDSELKFIEGNLGKMHPSDIANKLGRSYNSVTGVISRLNLSAKTKKSYIKLLWGLIKIPIAHEQDRNKRKV